MGLFGYGTEPVAPKSTRLDFAPVDFLESSKNIEKLRNNAFFDQGYERLVFNNFDFTKDHPFCDIINLAISGKFIFHNALFTFTQLEKLLEVDFDLSCSTYRAHVSWIQYHDLYDISDPCNLKSLHGLRVDFNNEDLREYPDNLLALCKPVNLKNTKITSGQLYTLLEKCSYHEQLDLSGISFEGVSLSILIKKYSDRLFYRSHGAILLKETKVQYAIFDEESLALCALNPKYYAWFNENNLSFSFQFNGNIIPINRDSLLMQLEDEKKSITPRMASPLPFFENVHNVLKKDKMLLTPLSFSTMKPGEKLLWVFYCAHHHPEGDVGKYIWRTLGINKKFGYVYEPATDVNPFKYA